MLILTARNPLSQKYGSEGYEAISTALKTFAAANGGVVAAVDDPADMQAFGLSARGNSAGEVQAAVRMLALRNPSLASSVLLAGGDSVLPFFSLSNPVQDRSVDPDDLVLSDNPYGALSDSLEEQLAPSLPVGRLPFSGSASTEEAIEFIKNFPQRFGSASTENAIEFIETLPERSGGSSAGLPGAALVVFDDWIVYSQNVAQALPSPQIWHISPGYEMNSATRADAARAVLYFNLHGFTGDPDWKGYSTIQRNFVSAVTPGGLDRSCVAGALAFAECCYGAEIAGRTTANSCALKLVHEGANFVGATGLAYGSYINSDLLLEDADFLSRAFFATVGEGQPVGAALATAKRRYLADSSESSFGNASQYKQKTLLQFVLLGNPETVH